MRLQRLLILLIVVIFACLSLLLLRREKLPRDAPLDLSSPPSHDVAPPPPVQLPPAHKGVGSAEKPHPIARLIENADQQFDYLRSRQSNTLADAVKEYRRRYNMHPPPHFDKWFEFARAKGVQLTDEYDTIYNSLLPFWGLEPRSIRERAREALGFDNAMLGVLVRNGKVTFVDGGGDGGQWQREATVEMMKGFVQYLPDMDLVFNTHDEPRVVVPSDDLARLVKAGKYHAVPSSFSNQSPANQWSKRPSNVNKGDRIEEYRTTRFNQFAHQPTWADSRSSCPVDSPARSLSESVSDDDSAYAYGDLGFIYNTTALSDICYTPSLRHSYGFFDRPNAFDIVHDLFPIFSQSKISSFQDIIYPSPWYWANRVPYDEKEDFRWDGKKDQMYWRGSTTGGFSRAGGWRRQHRQLFVHRVNGLGRSQVLSDKGDDSWVPREVSQRDYGGLFDVKFTYIGQCDPGDCNAQHEFFDVVEPAGQHDAWAYKYLVDIDGNAFSGRFYSFLYSNSLVAKIAIFREWHDEWLKPWVHYVPLGLKGSEYTETARYFSSEDAGKQAAPRIAEQGKDWARKVLRNEDLEVWFFRLLLE